MDLLDLKMLKIKKYQFFQILPLPISFSSNDISQKYWYEYFRHPCEAG